MPENLNQPSKSQDAPRSRKFRWALSLGLLLVCAVAATFYFRRNFGTQSAMELVPAHGSNAHGGVAAQPTTNATSNGTNRPPDRTGGVTYIHDEVPNVPWSIHIVKVERARADLRFETTLGLGRHIGMSLVSEQVKAIPAEAGHPLAAVNGDFYKNGNKYPGDPEGIQILRGELVSAPRGSHSCFWIDGSGNPHIAAVQSRFQVTLPDGRIAPFGLNEERAADAIVLYTAANGASTRTADGIELVLSRGTNANWLPLRAGKTYTAQVKQVRTTGDGPLSRETMVLSVGPKISSQVAGLKPGDALTISTATTPDLAGSTAAIGGGPALVHGRTAVKFSGLQPRHPRTALGWNKDYFFLVEVDGRQQTSAGMNFPELATYFLNLGCDEAINLDGGGSATMWVYGNVMNSPSEGRERPAANALVVVRKPAN